MYRRLYKSWVASTQLNRMEKECPDEIKYTVKKVLYGIILIVIGIILAALHFIVAGDGIRDLS